MLQFRSFILLQYAALVFIITFLNVALVGAVPGPGRYAVLRRDDSVSFTALSSTISNSASETGSISNSGAAATSSVVVSSSASSETTAATTTSSSSISSSSEASTTTASHSTQTTTTIPAETGLFNSTATPNLLPLTPTITPAFSVAGALLLLTGLTTTFIGIKTQRLHIFLSASYLTNLSITVLIIYIMNPPISNGIQGAYLVAILIPGIVVGGLAIVFPDMTEGLGCILGGFCFAMWLLVLKPGGLVSSTSGVSVMIAVFCAVGFATSFWRVTRPYGLIVSLSFAGATAIVLGIDCFSRAGLKEFWAWIWNLNDNLFPLGATTYPITRGIRVEIAAIFVIFLAGMGVQFKLWKIIAKKKEERKSRKRQDEEDHEREERDVGRQIEERSGPERDQWEAVYGDGDRLRVPKRPVRSIADSGVGDMDSPKKTPHSTVTSIHRPSSDEQIEMAEMGMTSVPIPKPSDSSVMSTHKAESSAGVRAAHSDRDEISTIPEFDDDDEEELLRDTGRLNIDGADRSDGMVKASSERRDKRQSKTSVPEIIPLPFRVPTARDSTISDDASSSIATYNDEIPSPREKRFSAGNPLKRLSRTAMRNSQRLSGLSLDGLNGWSKISKSGKSDVGGYDDRRSSVAATIDGISDKDDLESLPADMTAISPLATSPGFPFPTVEEEKKAKRPVSMSLIELQRTSFGSEKNSLKSEGEKSRRRSLSLAETVATAILESPSEEVPRTKDVVVETKTPSLTEEVLPPTPSKVVMSYRTNEWAKHLSNAEIPAIEKLKLNRASSRPLPQKQVPQTEEADVEEQDQEEYIDDEIPAPLDIQALQQTATNGTPPPAPRLRSKGNNRSSSSLTPTQHQQGPRSPSGISPRRQGPPQAHQNQNILPGKRRSSGALRQPVQRSGSSLSLNNGGGTPSPIPLYAHASSGNGTSSTPNLLSQRQTLIKQKHSFMSLNPLTSTPELEVTGGDQTQPSTPGLSSNDSASLYSRSLNAHSEKENSQERELSDNMSLKERKALIIRDREAALRAMGAASPYRVTDENQLQLQQRNSSSNFHSPSKARAKRSSLGQQTPGQREAMMASFRASVQEDLQGINRQRSSSALAIGNPAAGYGNGFGMGGGNNVGNSAAAHAQNGRISVMQEREIDARREQLFEEKKREGFMAAMRKGEEERRRGARDEMIRGGALDGRSGVEGAHREVMRRLQRKASQV